MADVSPDAVQAFSSTDSSDDEQADSSKGVWEKSGFKKALKSTTYGKQSYLSSRRRWAESSAHGTQSEPSGYITLSKSVGYKTPSSSELKHNSGLRTLREDDDSHRALK